MTSSLYVNKDGVVYSKLKIVTKLTNFGYIFIDILKNMGKAKEITPRKRAVVLQYLKDGCKQKDIAKKLKLSESVVCRLKKTVSGNWVSTGERARRSAQGIQ